MGSLFTIVIGFGAIVLFLHFRKQAERANQVIQQYCQEQELQWLSTAAAGLRWQPQYGHLLCYRFNFEFSSNGENCYQGTLLMAGPRDYQFILPPYQVN